MGNGNQLRPLQSMTVALVGVFSQMGIGSVRGQLADHDEHTGDHE